MGTSSVDIKEKEIPAIIVGSDVYPFKNNDDLYQFWTNFKYHIIHELVHFNDYRRIKLPPKSSISSAEEYYNNPLEFNAYYLEVAHYFYSKLKHNQGLKSALLSDRDTFIKEVWDYIYTISYELKTALSEKMIFKWNKRIYQLFDELKTEFS